MALPPKPVDATTTRRPWWRRWWGNRSERLAWKWASRQGWRIVARNASCPLGELDLVALDGRTLVFVEVRSRQAGHPEDAARSVNLEKQRRVSRMALWFRNRHRLEALAFRMDVLAIIWPENGQPVIEHHANAFEMAVSAGMSA